MAESSDKKLGFVGLGVMGGNMVARLLEKGHTVTGYNRTKVEGAVADRQRDAVGRFAAGGRGSRRLVLSMVTDSSALGKIAGGEDGIIAGLGARQSSGST